MTPLGFHEARAASARVTAARKAAKLSQEALAALLGVPVSWVSNRERGAVRMTLEAEQRIATALGLAPQAGDGAR